MAAKEAQEAILSEEEEREGEETRSVLEELLSQQLEPAALAEMVLLAGCLAKQMVEWIRPNLVEDADFEISVVERID